MTGIWHRLLISSAWEEEKVGFFLCGFKLMDAHFIFSETLKGEVEKRNGEDKEERFISRGVG